VSVADEGFRSRTRTLILLTERQEESVFEPSSVPAYYWVVLAILVFLGLLGLATDISKIAREKVSRSR
jgi:hypothetical protein